MSASSNEFLEQAERSIEELYTASVSRAALSMLLNDNVLAYRGEDYEDIYLNVFKALNYLALDRHDDALVEIRRLNNKLQLLTDKYGQLAASLNRFEDKHVDFKAKEVDFLNDALGRYLGALQLLEDLSRVAEVAFQRNQSLIYLKSITRTVLKGIAGKKAKEKFADEEQTEDKNEKKDKKRKS